MNSWKDLDNAVLSRTVDWFIKNWAKCPTLAQFKEVTLDEQKRQNKAFLKDLTDSCPKCDSGWIQVDVIKDTFRPCDACRVEQFNRWQVGTYRPS
tara:strand:+ start:8203 stop:8487 length:285 start_codon:yes stop_codon:yes gene_type:complete